MQLIRYLFQPVSLFKHAHSLTHLNLMEKEFRKSVDIYHTRVCYLVSF